MTDLKDERLENQASLLVKLEIDLKNLQSEYFTLKQERNRLFNMLEAALLRDKND